jgi:hypothetical protein
MNRAALMIVFTLAAVIGFSCDMRSGIARGEMEKYVSSPTPPISPIPTATPVDPAERVDVDVNKESDSVSIDGYKEKKSATCAKFERVRVNGDGNEITVKGVCRQVMVNGDSNKIKIDAAIEIVFNGTENTIQYSRFPNGKEPIVIENRPGNIVEKAASAAMTNQNSKSKIVK